MTATHVHAYLGHGFCFDTLIRIIKSLNKPMREKEAKIADM